VLAGPQLARPFRELLHALGEPAPDWMPQVPKRPRRPRKPRPRKSAAERRAAAEAAAEAARQAAAAPAPPVIQPQCATMRDFEPQPITHGPNFLLSHVFREDSPFEKLKLEALRLETLRLEKLRRGC